MNSITVVSSTAPGKVVDSSEKASGVFAAQLVQAMKTPVLDFAEVISRTRAAVAPHQQGSARMGIGSAPTELVVTPAARPGTTKPAGAVEMGFWDTIKDSETAADYQAYLSAYPNGQFALIARSKLAQLQPNAAENPAADNPAYRQTAAASPAQVPAPATAAPPLSRPRLYAIARSVPTLFSFRQGR